VRILPRLLYAILRIDAWSEVPQNIGLKESSLMALTKIDDYITLYSANQFPPRIWLQANNMFIGQLIFEPDGTPLPPDNEVNGQVNLYYHLENFPHALDLLESDTGVSLLYSGSGPGFENGLLTASENIGDDELKQALARKVRS
jgi:hypothetical protein